VVGVKESGWFVRRVLVVVLVTLLGAALAQGDRDAVVATTMAWQEGFNAADAAAVASNYAEDLVWVTARGLEIRDRAGVIAQVERLRAANLVSITIQVDDVLVVGDLATTMGTYEFATADGGSVPGRFIAAFVQRDGRWWCIRHVSYVPVE
jgi:uncharacterized protein (TIGR02246 family)